MAELARNERAALPARVQIAAQILSGMSATEGADMFAFHRNNPKGIRMTFHKTILAIADELIEAHNQTCGDAEETE